MSGDFFSMVILALALAWASGINVYGVFVMLGLGSFFGFLHVPPSLDFTAYPLVFSLAIIMFMIEFVVDKVPVVDSGWDSFHTIIRVCLGALLASQVFGEESFAFMFTFGLIGAFVAGSSHSVKAGSRVMINTSPEPFSNGIVSMIEDIVVFGGIYLAFTYPLIFLTFFFAYAFALIWLLPKIFRGIKKVFSFVFGSEEKPLHVKEEENLKMVENKPKN